MPVAASYPFLEILGSMLVFFGFVMWLMLVFNVFGDIFRRHDISGWGKAGWSFLIIFLPFLGVLVYLGTQARGMAERKMQEVAASQAQFDAYIRDTAAGGDGAASEIAKAKQLLDGGTITQAEFDDIKRKALA